MPNAPTRRISNRRGAFIGRGTSYRREGTVAGKGQQALQTSPFELYKKIRSDERKAANPQWMWWKGDDQGPEGWWWKDLDGKWNLHDHDAFDDNDDDEAQRNEDEQHNTHAARAGVQWEEKTGNDKEDRLAMLWADYNGKWHTLQNLRRQGERWGNPLYDLAWKLCEEARAAYNLAKPPIPRSQKLGLLHSDVAKAEELVEKAEEGVANVRAKLQEEEAKLLKAKEKLDKQKQRLTDFKGEYEEQNDAYTGAEWAVPFAANAREVLDQCGSTLLSMAEDIKAGNVEEGQQQMELLFSRLGGLRDDAWQAERS